MYVLVNGTLLSEEGDFSVPQKGPLDIEVIFIQTKNTNSFEENALKLVRTTVNDLLDLKKEYKEFAKSYSEKLQETFSLARRALLASAGRTANIRVRFFYAAKGDTSEIHENVHSAAGQLASDLKALAATSDVSFEFTGAKQLIEISRQPKTRNRVVESEQLLPSSSGDSFSCLVPIRALMKFLSDEHGNIIRSLFDANVRDFMGMTEVNEAIALTLKNLSEGDFWWFNNGITIVASGVDQKGKMLVLTDPLVVNGLQTSSVIHAFMSNTTIPAALRESREKQLVLVKIIVPPDEKTRDGIIKATNSQTHIPKPYLRGMDSVHRNIEDHLKSFELFYERRKSQYKNMGAPRRAIVTLGEMAQALMAAFLFRGGDARGRPTSLLKSDEDYVSLFSEDYPIDAYKNVILAKRLIMMRLAEKFPDRPSSFKNDVVFHVLSYISGSVFWNAAHAASGWRTKVLSNEECDSAIDIVVPMFDKAGGTDRIAKSKDFQDAIQQVSQKIREAGTKPD